ncbi:MAG: DUF434 domain-containing protein [archaeon GB-1867-035]|nr:DUF434 domain-containing protein [Candidatus Culexmicrobium profundum]
MISIERIKEAVTDMRYLLSRGYTRKSAAIFVANRYHLTKDERAILYRAVYDEETVRKHREKLVSPSFVNGKILAIDGFNVLITVESGLKGKVLVECDDGFIRDVSAVFGKYVISDYTFRAIELILDYVSTLNPQKTLFFFDSPVSRSGELASNVRSYLRRHGIDGDARAIKKSDIAVLTYGEVVATSDCVIIERADKVLDLAGQIARRHFSSLILKINL